MIPDRSIARTAVLLLGSLLATGGCEPGRGDALELASTQATAPEVVDTVIDIDRALQEFRADLGEPPSGLEGGFDSPEALVEALRSAVKANDAPALEGIALSRKEFAYFYYPDSPLARPPYELPPALAWFQLQQGSRTGALRLLRELGGRDTGELVLSCPRPPVEQGDGRLLPGCHVRLSSGEELRLFGALLEYDGRWKVITFANDF